MADDPEGDGNGRGVGEADRTSRSLARDRRFLVEAVVVLAVFGVLSAWLLPEGNSILTLPLAGLYLGWRAKARWRDRD
ncbi:hypothetical protein [Kitasatospora sp. SUK 42]|uniref:hypothetical protein n=1 Tax=Kitasatospora sp. SUK 42 TaxID=1588882 RepID=UPI0018CA688B|nr:hypothetical protein [Kitasatospora sp. SUK 42]MBV2151542.1 hypothetical protein [Kitasatospora sp. SUK 42]